MKNLIVQTERNRIYIDFFNQYRSAVYSFIYRKVGHQETAEDLLQEAFIRAFVSLDRYNPSLPFSSWLFKIASNLCIDHLRRQKHKFLSLDASIGEDNNKLYDIIPSKHYNPSHNAEQEETRNILIVAINNLPQNYRSIIFLRYMEELSYQEIADKLNLSLGVVKKRLFRGRKRLQTMLHKHSLH